VSKLGAHFYNFWRDQAHVRGVWRRTSLAEYRKAEPHWETVLDLDHLAEQEQENWVWGGASALRPDYDRCLVSLSRGGGDSCVVREFDLLSQTWVASGFELPEAKSDVSWRDRDTLFVATDFGPDSLTSSGYPRVLKSWRRGTPLTAAETIFEAQPSDIGVSAAVLDHDGYRRELVTRVMTFRTNHFYTYQAGALLKLDVPDDASLYSLRDQLLLVLKSELRCQGRSYPAGALLALSWADFLAGKRDFALLFTPSERRSLAGISHTRHYLIVNELDNIHHVLRAHRLAAGEWHSESLDAPELGSVWTEAVDSDHSDDYFLWTAGFLTPDSWYLGTLGAPGQARELLKQLPAFFDARALRVSQHQARSRDGTQIPYFQVAPADLTLDASHMTLLTGYGGFEVSNTPTYSGGLGLAWLEQGGVYVVANIRGGGEFGPAWHQAALQPHRQRAFDDFIAVAEDLIARKVSRPAQLGIMGGSNGGLLVGVAVTQRPELFNAAVCQVPLLDMRRYHKLLAGASWISEYGDPDDPTAWEYIAKYSPYHNVRDGQRYPRVLFTTSTRDDRVHPAHARKLAAKLLAADQDVLLYENLEGGHGGAANNPQQAFMSALAYTFLAKQLG
jgi:prolyl oligopeptidase